MKLSKKLFKIYPLIFSFILIYFLILNMKDFDFLRNIKNIDTRIIIVSCIIFCFIKISNTYRYSEIYNIKEKLKLFFVLNFCNFYLNLIPFRMGEISYIKYLNEYFNIKKLTAINKLILIRFCDLILIYLLFLYSSFYVGFSFKNDILFYISLFFVTTPVLILIFIGLLNIWNNRQISINNKYIENFLLYCIKIYQELLTIKRKDLIILFLNTMIYWFLRIIMAYSILYLLGLKISVWLIVYISFLLLLIGLLPIQTFAGFGIFEGGWIYFLMDIGYKYEEILPFIINYHIALLIPVVFYGLLSYLALKFLKF